MTLSGEIINLSALPPATKEAMFALMTRHYDNVSREKFARDLSEKDGVLLFQDEEGQLGGFTTFLVMNTRCQGGPCRVLYSGDTIIEKQHWGQMILFRTFAALLHRLLEEGEKPVYWFLLSKGIRTYLMLPLYFKRFFPAWQAHGEDPEVRILHQLARDRFGNLFLPEQGVVRFDPPAEYLKAELAEIPAEKLTNKHVQFFLQRNPGYVRGDELACITRVAWDNFTGPGLRFMRS
ncbi:MAG TPA: hypothetical protein PLG66_02695 [Calditrichia bacterium]|nr:hypothetical protein [Calditrichia bacterium]